MDWKRLIADLSEANMTQAQIASACGCSQVSVSDLYTGKTASPNFDLGQRLVNLHRSVLVKSKRARATANPTARGGIPFPEPSHDSPSYMDRRSGDRRQDPSDVSVRRYEIRRKHERIG